MVWALTRMAMLRIFTSPHENYITGDVNYYRWWLTASHLPDSRVLLEYPVPVLWGLRSLVWFSGGPQGSYFVVLFAVTMLGLDALMTLALWQAGHRHGAWWWVFFVPALGPLMWFRFDMVPAVCMGFACLWFRRHPAASGTAVALGAAVKLWPALLIAPMVGRRPAALRRVVAFGLTGVGLALASWVVAGWDRLTSPLTWQSDRGLQVEAISATWPMGRHVLDPSSGYRVAMSRYNAYEVTGPSVGTWLGFSSLLMVLSVALAVGLGILAWRRNGLDQRSAVLAAATIVGALIVANKTLSPQYFVWWGATVAVMVDPFSGERRMAVSPEGTRATTRLQRHAWTAAGLLLATANLTQCLYPVSYGRLVLDNPSDWAFGLLLARNLCAVATLVVCSLALRTSLALAREPLATTA